MKARGRARGVTSTFEGPARVITERAPRGRAAPAVMFLAPMSPAAATVAPSCTVVSTTAPTPVGKGGTRTSTELRGLLDPPGVTAMREWLGNPTASCKLARFVLSDEVLNTAALGERVMAAALRRRPRQSSPPPERGPLFLTWAGKGFVIGGSLIGAVCVLFTGKTKRTSGTPLYPSRANLRSLMLGRRCCVGLRWTRANARNCAGPATLG